MRRTLPPAFVAMFRSYGASRTEEVITALADGEPSVSVRANSLRGATLRTGLEPVPWLNPGGAYLDERPMFAADPAWHQGLYYVQDASSMTFTAIVNELAKEYFDGRPLCYLDACAAPGGKTIAAIEGLPEGSLVVANEYDRSRAAVLMENTSKHGYPSIVITNSDASDIGAVGECFDIIAVDAPCSGEGMFRKEPDAIAQWTPGLVEACAAKQSAIVRGVWNALRPGGILIYSTCTFNSTENEEIVSGIIDTLGGESIPLPALDSYEGVQAAYSSYKLHGYHFFPGLIRGEGLFVAAIRKPSHANGKALKFRVKEQCSKITPQISDFASLHIKSADKYCIINTDKDSYTLVPKVHKELCLALTAKLKTTRTGLPLGTLKGKSIQPAWQLSYSTALLTDSFPRVKLDYNNAIRYLHGESLCDVTDGIPTGYALCTYNSVPLGFIKNIGRRANNLLPSALSLRLNPSKLPTPTILVQ